MVERLVEDHARARNLAEGLSEVPGLELLPGTPATNMIFLTLGPGAALSARELESRLAQRGVLVGVVSERGLRLVTHYWIDDGAVGRAVDAFAAALK
jgi:threonine aldolase